MAKPALGRDLGKLMGRAPNDTGADSVGRPPLPGAGVRSLLQGQAAAPKPVIPRWYLFAGDALLIALALITAFVGPHPLSLAREVFCVATALLAALLAVFAVLMPENGARSPLSAGAGVVANGESPKQFGNQKANAPGAKQ